MNPHGWESFGDFAADAGLGLVLLFVLLGLYVWRANR